MKSGLNSTFDRLVPFTAVTRRRCKSTSAGHVKALGLFTRVTAYCVPRHEVLSFVDDHER